MNITKSNSPIIDMSFLEGSGKFRGSNYKYRIYYNSKPIIAPIVLLSGAFQNMDSWKRYVAPFHEHTTVVLVDLANAGILPSNVPFSFLAAMLNDLLTILKIEKVNLLSISYGTPIAYYFAKENPEKVDNLVLSGTMKNISVEHQELFWQSIDLMEKDNLKEFSELMKKALLFKNEKKIKNQKLAKKLLELSIMHIKSFQKRMYIENSKRLLNTDEKKLKLSTDIRTLVFTGEYDPFTTPDRCRQIAIEINNSIFTTIKGCDHLFSLENLESVIRLVTEFLLRDKLNSVEGCSKIEFPVTDLGVDR